MNHRGASSRPMEETLFASDVDGATFIDSVFLFQFGSTGVSVLSPCEFEGFKLG